MLGHMVYCFLALLLVTNSARGATVTFPLDDCDVVKYLDNTDVTGANAIDLASTTGPDSYDVYAYTNPNSYMNIPKASVGLSVIRSISFNLKINSQGNPTPTKLFQLTDPTGNGFVVKQNGPNIDLIYTFPSLTQPVTLANFPVGAWNTIKISTGVAASLFITNAYKVTLNGATILLSGFNFPDFVVGDVEFFSFDGAMSCLTISDAADATDLTITQTQCVNFQEMCSPTQSTPPQVNPVPLAICDVSDVSNCESVNYSGTGFDNQDTYNCTIQTYELNAAGQLVAGSIISLPAIYISDIEVICNLPSGTHSAAVTLVSDTFGDLATGNVVVVPLQCFNCQDQFTCTTTGDGCYINGICVDPYVVVNGNFSQICLPDLNPLGPSLRTVENVDIEINSCGKSRGIAMDRTTEGFISQELALAAASYSINLNLVAKVQCNAGDQTVLLAEFAPGIKIYQEHDKIIMELNFINSETGQLVTTAAEIEVGSGNWLIRRPDVGISKRSINKWYGSTCKNWFRSCRGKGDCAVAVAFKHDAETGETSLFVNGRETEDNFEEIQGQLLLTTGRAFVSKNQIACFQINNNVNNRWGYRKRTRSCFQFVCRRKNCNGSDTSSASSSNSDNSS